MYLILMTWFGDNTVRLDFSKKPKALTGEHSRFKKMSLNTALAISQKRGVLLTIIPQED